MQRSPWVPATHIVSEPSRPRPAIGSATAVIVAIALEGGMPEPTPPSPALPPSAPPTAIAASLPPRESASQLVVAAGGIVDTAMLPSFATGFEAALGWAYSLPKWRIRAVAGGSFFLPQNSPALMRGLAAGESGHFNLFAAGLRVCGSIVRNAFDLGPCLGVEIDVMNGAGAGGPAQSLRSTGLWGSALGSLLASWSFSRHLAITLRAEGFYAPNPVQFVVKYFPPPPDHIPVHQPSQTGARGALSMEFRFF